ncbi:MFS transporter [bacterium]|nr:MFS transporter [bacterium]
MRFLLQKEVLSWAFYDFANTIYSMNVVSLYFPLWVTSDLGGSDLVVSVANSVSMLLVALTLPVLGIFSDALGNRKGYLFGFTLSCVIAVALIGFLASSSVPVSSALLFGTVLYVIANYSYNGGLVFYNSLLPGLVDWGKIGRVSGFGVFLGYLGSIFGMLFVMPFNTGTILGYSLPEWLAGGREKTFIPTAVLFLLFSLPIFIFVKEERIKKNPPRETVWSAFAKLWETLKDTGGYPGIRRFLVAKFFYEDAIATAIIFMAVYAEKVMGLPDRSKIAFFVVATVGAAFGSLFGGILVDSFSPKRVLQAALVGWILSLLALIISRDRLVFWIIGAFIGTFLGWTWTSARPLLLELSPPEAVARFFGLYSFSGRLAAILGPLMWGLIVKFLSPYGGVFAYRVAVLYLALMIAIGLLILERLKFPKASLEVSDK